MTDAVQVRKWLMADKSAFIDLEGIEICPGLALVKHGKLYDLIHVVSGMSAVPWQIRHLLTTKKRANAWSNLLQEFIDFRAEPLVLPPNSLMKQQWEGFSGAILHSR